MKTKTNLVHLNSDLFAISDDKYKSTYSIQISIQILEEEQVKSPRSKLDFHKNMWKLWFDSEGTSRTIDFTKLEEITRFHSRIDYKEFTLLVKCWLANLINRYSYHYTDSIYRYFLDFLKISFVFDLDETDNVETYLKYKCSQRQQYDIALSTLNFLDFYRDMDPDYEYENILTKIREANSVAHRDDFQRDLPPTKEVYYFNWLLNDYFSKLDRSSEEFLLYFPIYLWWNLTMIIPLRPSEFCDITRDALFSEDGQYFIRLPREKQPKNRVQIIDTIPISEDLAKDILFYSEKIQAFDECLTLLHPNTSRFKPSLVMDAYTTTRLYYVLHLFYKDIVGEQYGNTFKPNKYGFPVEVEDEDEAKLYNITKPIAPGDTRHFAMLNLMRQAHHPLEMARLAGHSSIYSQTSYYSHLNYWVDVEILQLMEKIAANIETAITGNDIDDEDFKNQFVLKPSTGVHIPLDLGFCTEKNQHCPVDECFHCPYWRLTEDDFINKQTEIKEALDKSYSHIQQLLAVLTNLQKIVQMHMDKDFELSENDYLYNKDLAQIKLQLDLALQKHAYVQYQVKKFSKN